MNWKAYVPSHCFFLVGGGQVLFNFLKPIMSCTQFHPKLPVTCGAPPVMMGWVAQSRGFQTLCYLHGAAWNQWVPSECWNQVLRSVPLFPAPRRSLGI